jgi:hypothetical protein
MAFSGIAMTASPCWACSCVETTKQEQADDADVVFFGKVRSISGGDADDGVLGDDNIRVRFRVRTVYKGKVQRLTTVRTNESGAACGASFKEGERYTVFADRNAKKLHTSLCSGTKKGNINPANYGLPEGYPPED